MSGFASPGVLLFESAEAGSDFQLGFSRLRSMANPAAYVFLVEAALCMGHLPAKPTSVTYFPKKNAPR